MVVTVSDRPGVRQRAVLARLKDARYVWGGESRRGRRAHLSDHAALVLDLSDI
jgi:hypothetical protein